MDELKIRTMDLIRNTCYDLASYDPATGELDYCAIFRDQLNQLMFEVVMADLGQETLWDMRDEFPDFLVELSETARASIMPTLVSELASLEREMYIRWLSYLADKLDVDLVEPVDRQTPLDFTFQNADTTRDLFCGFWSFFMGYRLELSRLHQQFYHEPLTLGAELYVSCESLNLMVDASEVMYEFSGIEEYLNPDLLIKLA